MGIIKLKNVNEEQQENAQPEGVQVFEAEVEIPVSEEKPQKEQEQWDDPAVLHEDEARTDENSRHYILNNGTAKSSLRVFLTRRRKNGNRSTTLLRIKGTLLRTKTENLKLVFPKQNNVKK